jgi:hypothetical protein
MATSCLVYRTASECESLHGAQGTDSIQILGVSLTLTITSISPSSIMYANDFLFLTHREAEKTKDAVLPDFHRLVNFPDYLAKSRSPSSSDSSSPANGKKNCVMCGKVRVCSASSLVKGRVMKQEECVQEEQDDGTAHIIPRQNKGLCTACDITVWVVVTDGLEIKWCKGCKNFRPWAAFGDKGSATKCVRCRDRQREKYATQKDEIRLRRYKRTTSSSDSSRHECSDDNSNSKEEDNHMAAARGLRNLMKAAEV